MDPNILLQTSKFYLMLTNNAYDKVNVVKSRKAINNRAEFKILIIRTE